MEKIWVDEVTVVNLDKLLDQAHDIVMGCKHNLEAHKESYRRAVRLGDIKPDKNPKHKVTITQEALTTLRLLGQALISPSLVEQEDEGR